jgi:hypothetical protein
MSELALFIVGVGVFTVTLMAVLWTGYLVFASGFDTDRAKATSEGDQGFVDLPHVELPSLEA